MAERTGSLTLRLLVMVLLCAIATLLTGPSFHFSADVYHEGDIAPKSVKARSDFLIEDQQATAAKRLEAPLAVPPVYDRSPRALAVAIQTLTDSFLVEAPQTEPPVIPPGEAASATQAARIPASAADTEKQQLPGEQPFILQLEKRWSVEISDELAADLMEMEQRQQLLDLVGEALSPLLQGGVVANRELFIQEGAGGRGVTLRDAASSDEFLLENPEGVFDFDVSRKELIGKHKGEVKSTQTLARLLAAALLRPNLTYNGEETGARRTAAAEQVGPVLEQVRRGEMLVREGDRVSAVQARRLSAHANEVGAGEPRTIEYFSLFLILLFITGITYEFGRHNVKKVRLAPRDLLFLAFLFLLLLALQRLGMAMAERLDGGLADALRFAMPLGAGFIVSRMVLNSETTLVFSLPFIAAGAVGAGLESGFLLPLAFGGMVGAHKAGRAGRRLDYFRIGMWVGVIQAVAVALIGLMQGTLPDGGGWWPVAGALVGGLFCGLVALSLVPLVELMFGYTTDMRLTELARMDHPLLRDLMIRAPGTYHHSMVVGTLVQAAAEAIGARAVLSTVAAYYHDIGKISKPMYFIENQEGTKNPHDKLTASMSTLILTSHIKEGVEMAERHRLGRNLIDIIEQHHGTGLISFFYNKACSTARPGVDEVDKRDFRYPGPKPQTREAALVMLADAVEAAGRTLPDPRPARIQGMVQNLVNRIFADGQLDECDLALQDLHRIARSFTRILSGIHHQRIDYPLAAHKEKRDDADLDSKRQPEGDDQRDEAAEQGKENLKRLGM